MKKNLLYYLFAILCTIPLFISCSDENNADIGNDNIGNNVDGDDETSSVITIPVEQFVGDYKGALTVNASGEDEVETYQTISITKAGENSINLIVANYDYTGFPLGDIELEDVSFNRREGDAYICQREEQLTLNLPFGTCNVKTLISIRNSEIMVDLDIMVPALENRVVKVAYQGVMLNGQENNEAKILNFAFEGEDMENSIIAEKAVINEELQIITFAVWSYATETDLKALVPIIEVSEGATLQAPEVMDFSKDMVYTVISQDWSTVNTYTVKAPIRKSESTGDGVLIRYDFDSWDEVSGTREDLYVNTKNFTWETPHPIEELVTTNEAVAIVRGFMGSSYKGAFNVVKEEGYGGKGYAAKLETLNSRGSGAYVAPAIIPGALFTGTFEFPSSISSVPTKQLEYVKLGIPCAAAPSKLKGVYKYTPGAYFVDGSKGGSAAFETKETDAPAIFAVLYEARDENGNEVVLNGASIKNSSYRVAVAELKDNSPKAEWTSFEEDFVYEPGKFYDPAKAYKIVIICSASKEGDCFRGGVGSILIVDNIEVVGG